MSHVSLAVLRNSARLAALRQLGILDTPADASFDRLTRLAARILNVPVALVSLVDEERQFFKSAIGLEEPWATRRETPLSYSFCQYVVASGEPLIIEDAREHDLVRDNLSVSEMGVVAYAGMPLITRDGQRLGSFCVIDHQPRTWTQAEIEILNDLSASVMTEIELMIDNIERRRAEETAQRLAEQHKRLLEVALVVVSTLAIDEIMPQLQRTLQLVVAHEALSIYWLDLPAGLLRPAHQVAPTWMSDQVSVWPIPIDSGIAGAVARSGRAELVNNAQIDPRAIYPPGTHRPAQHHQISVPLRANEHIRGVFIMSRSSGEPFTEQEFELAQIFISFASLAIENARLFEQTKLAEERQRLLLEQVPCRLWTTDRELRYTSLVGTIAREQQIHPGSMIGMSIYEYFGTDDPQLLPIAAHRRALAGESSTYDLALYGRVFQTHVQPFRDPQGQVIGCIGVALDITERRQIEEDLREEFAFSTAIIDNASEGLCVCHPIAEYPYVAFTVWNDRMIEITGYTMDEINRLGWYQTLYVDPDLQAQAQARMERMRHGDDLIAEEWQITRADGQQRVVAFSTSVLDTREGNAHVLALLHDITDRKRAEAALRESEERTRRLSEVAFEGIAIHEQGIILDANQALAAILGYELPEIIGMPVLAFAAPESRDLIMANMRSEATQPYEVVGLRKDGSRVQAELQAKSILYQGRSVRVAAIRDITDRKQAEAALRASEERFRTLIRDLQVGVLLQGSQSEILLSNQAALDLLGLTEDQLLGKTSFDPKWNVIHEDGTPFPGPDHPVPQAIATRRPVRDVVMGVYRPLTKDRVWLLVNAEPQLADDGSVRQVICSFSDITTSKQAEAALRESEERYRTFFEHSIDAILLTAPDGSIFAANPAACQIFDRTEAEICQVGRNGLIDTTDPRLPVALEQRARTGKFKGELTFLRQDGTPFPGELSTALFRDRENLIKSSMIIRDITERKRAEHEREELIDALQNALANIKTLRGLLPICASCKKIRDDLGYWSQIEAYVQAHSDAVFSHGICPDCAKKLYGEFLEE